MWIAPWNMIWFHAFSRISTPAFLPRSTSFYSFFSLASYVHRLSQNFHEETTITEFSTDILPLYVFIITVRCNISKTNFEVAISICKTCTGDCSFVMYLFFKSHCIQCASHLVMRFVCHFESAISIFKTSIDSRICHFEFVHFRSRLIMYHYRNSIVSPFCQPYWIRHFESLNIHTT